MGKLKGKLRKYIKDKFLTQVAQERRDKRAHRKVFMGCGKPDEVL